MRLPFAVLLCALALPATASAEVVVTNDGLAVTVQGDGAANHITTSGSHGVQQVLITAQGLVDSSDLCEPADGGIRCTDPDPGNDEKLVLTVNGGAGDDHLTDTASWITYPITRPPGSPLPGVSVLLRGDEGDDDVRGVSYTDSRGGEGNDRVEGWFKLVQAGGPGDDLIVGTQVDGNSKLAFNHWVQEPGADTYVTTPLDFFVFADGPVNVSLDAQPNDGRAGEGDNIGNQAQVVLGSPQDDVLDLTMAQRSVQADGGAGNDRITGGAWPDDLSGGPGADRVEGGGGEDELSIGDADDVYGGAGRDTLWTVARSSFYGGPGFEVSLDGVANDGERGAATSNVHPDVEVIYGSSKADRLVGAAEGQELHGGEGDDELVGGDGPDLLYGGEGADQLRGRDGGWDLLDCGDGNDPSAEGDDGDHVAGCELFALAPLPDRRTPFLGINSARRRSTGVRVQTFSDEKTALNAELRVGRRLLSRRALVSAQGTRAFLLRLSAANRRRLRRATVMTVTVRATDAAGNATTRTRRIRLRR
jgi:Ca2+-binding RTX toxin-like protein